MKGIQLPLQYFTNIFYAKETNNCYNVEQTINSMSLHLFLLLRHKAWNTKKKTVSKYWFSDKLEMSILSENVSLQ